ncbi:hypothetical protein ACFL1H_00970 [Nanoarchaeota archaeon]
MRGKLDIKKNIDKSIVNLLLKIIKEPLLHFSEADLQQMLVEELRKIKQLSKTYPTLVSKGLGSKSTYGTSLIHREYGGGDKSRIDVVIFDEKDVNDIDNINLTSKKFEKGYLPPLFAFELGTEKSRETKKHFDNDIKKLKKCKQGYLIHIFKDITQSKSGTGMRKNTEEKIKSQFKDVFISADSHDKIKVLAVLLRTGRNQAKMMGKCEIFTDGEWKKININKNKEIENVILKELR